MFVTSSENVDRLLFWQNAVTEVNDGNTQMKCIISFMRQKETLNEVLDFLGKARQIDKLYFIMLS